MRNILLFGAGRSASTLIKYFLDNSFNEQWKIIVVDASQELAQQKIGSHENGVALGLDIHDDDQRRFLIAGAHIVISMLPAALHYLVAQDCLLQKRNLVTASYVSNEIALLNDEAIKNDILIMNECGLDPGIDHLSAMKIIHELKRQGNELTSFKSYTGGLVAPESNDNPWGYKFTWNPRNVIIAGQGIAKYIENSLYKYIPYNRLFTQIEKISVDGYGSFDGYANRDSLAYRHHYGLEKIPTMLRGTLRYEGYCKAWDVFVRLGLTDDSFQIEQSEKLTYAQVLESFLPASIKGSKLSDRIKKFYGDKITDEIIDKIMWTGIAEPVKTNLPNATPAQILQQLLEQKWKLNEGDKDMVVMVHQFEFKNEESVKGKMTSTLVVKGDDTTHTAMSKTVGLPLAIVTKNILNGKIKSKGVKIPVDAEVYNPVLDELANYGIVFSEKNG
ncbi:MAG: saccharopine dehydrogenase C-terminal domain-containing protein [Bacteroidia bacterium]